MTPPEWSRWVVEAVGPTGPVTRSAIVATGVVTAGAAVVVLAGRGVGALVLGAVVLWAAMVAAVAVGSRNARAQVAEHLHRARHDDLTGLPNRGAFRHRLATALAAGPVAVVLLDLDRFKEINDTLGHHHGDELLVQVGRRLGGSQVEGGPVTVARLGGDEFAVLVPGLAEPDAAVAAVSCLLEVLSLPIEVDGLALEVAGSAGISLAPQHGRDPDELLQRADVAMYRAKADRTTVEVYDADRETSSARRLDLAHQLQRAVQNDQVVVRYQPKLDLRTMQVTGVEAVGHWQHPERGLVPTGDLSPVMEATALMAPMTAFVLDEALRQCRAWRDDGLALSVAVDLSASNVLDADLVRDVASALARHGVPPVALVLELTEATLLVNPARTAEVLDRLARLGVRLSVDGFGTGGASLAHLRRLPVDELKIDRSLVRGMAHDQPAAVLTRGSVELGRSLGLTVVADGVEDLAVLDLLTVLGCDEVQGAVVACPGSPDEVEAVARCFAAIRAREPGPAPDVAAVARP